MFYTLCMTHPTSASLLATESHPLTSKATGVTYDLSIALPYTYLPDTGKGGPFGGTLDAYPVVYLLDANWFFGLATDTVRSMAWCGRTYDAIIVGIGYPETDSAQETWRCVSELRANDLTPVRSDIDETDNSAWLNRPVKTGGGDKFYAFLKTELLPWVEQNYRADPAKRILAGHSYGGLFALYAALQEPDLFASYIAASPYLRDAARTLFTREPEYAASHTDLPTQIYLSAGEFEESADDTTITDLYRLAAALEARNYKGLSLTKQVLPDNNHCEAFVPGLQAGLKIALKR